MAYPIWLTKRVRGLFRSLGFTIQRLPNEGDESVLAPLNWSAFVAFLRTLDGIAPQHPSLQLGQVIHFSESQLGQDFVAAWLFGTSGFFVEFGAADGKNLSNTYLLEKMGWRGCLAEPSRGFHAALAHNRPTTSLDKRCVWSKSGEQLEFVEASAGELSTLKGYEKTDYHDRSDAVNYKVETVAFNDFLLTQGAPSSIEFLSIDTEGSEFEILNSLDHTKWRFGFIAVEHNATPNRVAIYDLLTRHGYVRIGERFSRWDDWYVHPEVLSRR